MASNAAVSPPRSRSTSASSLSRSMAVRTYQIRRRDSGVTPARPARSYLWRAGARAGEGVRVKVILNWGIVAFLGVLTCVAPMILGWWYAFKPSERLLVQLRPL